MSATLTSGRFLFRYRSFTPVPVIGLLALLLWRSQDPSAHASLALDAAGLALAALGQALRAWVLGQVPEGTSGQGNSLEAATLNTTGPYARVRNPLYLGNALIVAGLCAMVQDGWVAAVALAFFFGQYFFVIRAEEEFLRGQFGESFDAWCREVPRWLPRLTAASEGALSHRFDWRRALKKEHNPLTAWASGALAIVLWQAWVAGDAARALPSVLAAEGVLLAGFVAVKGWKHRWFSRGDETGGR